MHFLELDRAFFFGFFNVFFFLMDGMLHAQGIDLLKDKQALQRLTEAAEKAKIELSGVQEARMLETLKRESVFRLLDVESCRV